jgi:HD-GYP domain-containing protein (c-di-GMP phosphodiesterase class II)
VRGLARAARLHDIGKLAISNRILDKPGRLDDVEFAQVKAHPLVSQRILERVPGFSELAPLAGAHHERLDGTGYPRGLMADELTMPMRVLAVADVYEALTAERPYRSTYTAAQAFAIMRREVPRRLDPDAFAALEALLAAGLDRARQGDRHHASGAGVSELA